MDNYTKCTVYSVQVHCIYLCTCVSGIGDTAVGDEREEGIQTPPLHAALLELEPNAVDAEKADNSEGGSLNLYFPS